MTLLTRRSPKIAFGSAPQVVRDAIDTLEDRPRVPEKTPSSQSADGYHGEVCQDANYVYFYFGGSGWARIARTW